MFKEEEEIEGAYIDQKKGPLTKLGVASASAKLSTLADAGRLLVLAKSNLRVMK